MQTPEIRAKAMELAMLYNKHNSNYRTIEELIEIAKQFEKYLSEGYFPPYPYTNIPTTTIQPYTAPYVAPYTGNPPYPSWGWNSCNGGGDNYAGC